MYLIGTQHLNLNDSQVMDEVTDINRALRPAITKDIENLTKRIQREAQALPKPKVDKALRDRLDGELEANSRRAYQEVLVMPEVDEIKLSAHRVLVVVPPDNSVPPEEIERFYRSVTEKNNLLVLSGNDTLMASRVEETLRELYAIAKIAKNINSSDSLYAQAQDLKEEAEGAFIEKASHTLTVYGRG